jgi:hypothetical protein
MQGVFMSHAAARFLLALVALNLIVQGYSKLQLIMPFTAGVASKSDGLFGGTFSELAASANRAVPRPGEIGTRGARGDESPSSRLPGFARAWNQIAAPDNRQIPQRVVGR